MPPPVSRFPLIHRSPCREARWLGKLAVRTGDMRTACLTKVGPSDSAGCAVRESAHPMPDGPQCAPFDPAARGHGPQPIPARWDSGLKPRQRTGSRNPERL